MGLFGNELAAAQQRKQQSERPCTNPNFSRASDWVIPLELAVHARAAKVFYLMTPDGKQAKGADPANKRDACSSNARKAAAVAGCNRYIATT